MQALPHPLCPLCGAANQCAAATSGGFATECWCQHARIDPAILARVPPEWQRRACLCPACAGLLPAQLPWDAAIVDLDGTMVDTQGDFVLALGLMLRDLGLPVVDAAFVARTVGKGSEHLLRCTLAEVGGDPALYPAAWQAYQRHYLAINGEASAVYPGVLAGLQTLRAAGLRLACLTNKPLAFAQALLAAKGLAGFFELVFGGDSFARKKPDPLPLLETCRALGVAPGRTLVLGDSANDAQAADAAGCPVALVRYGYNHGEPIESVPALAHLDFLVQWPQAARLS